MAFSDHVALLSAHVSDHWIRTTDDGLSSRVPEVTQIYFNLNAIKYDNKILT